MQVWVPVEESGKAEAEAYRKVLEPVPVVVWVKATVEGWVLEQVRRCHKCQNTNPKKCTALWE